MEQCKILETKQWVEGNPVTLSLPLSVIIKRIIIDLYGDVVATYSGSPVPYPTNIMDILIPSITLNLGSGRTPKSIRPHTAQMFNLLTSGMNPVRRATTGSAAYALPKSVTVDAAFTFPTSTQHATFVESLVMNFEVPEAIALNGASTYLNLYKETYANLTYNCGNFANLEGSGVSVTYSSAALYIDTTLITVKADPNADKLDFRETVQKEQISGQISNKMYRIPTGQKLIGIGILAESNMGNTGSVEAFHKLNNDALKEIKLFRNSDILEKSTDFLRLNFENRVKFGINAPFATNVSRLDGYAYLNLLENRDLATALDLRTQSGIADAYVELTSAAARAAAPFLTYGLQVSLHLYELASVPKSI